MADIFEIAGRIHSTSQEEVVTVADEILDTAKNKKQDEINTETYSLVNDINERLSSLNPEQQGALSVAAKATNNETKLGYYVCGTEGNVAAKVISDATGYVLSTGGSMKVKMTNANIADNATLNINSTGAKPLYYDGERASANNTWEDGETVEVYYDGTNFYANNVAGGGGDGVFDVSTKYPTSGVDGGNTYTLEGALAVLNANLSASKKKGGMRIQFIQSSDNKYVQYRLTSDTFSINESDWQGVDNKIEQNSRNLTTSGAIFEALFDRVISLNGSVTIGNKLDMRSIPYADYSIKVGDKITFKLNDPSNAVRYYLMRSGSTNMFSTSQFLSNVEYTEEVVFVNSSLNWGLYIQADDAIGNGNVELDIDIHTGSINNLENKIENDVAEINNRISVLPSLEQDVNQIEKDLNGSTYDIEKTATYHTALSIREVPLSEYPLEEGDIISFRIVTGTAEIRKYYMRYNNGTYSIFGDNEEFEPNVTYTKKVLNNPAQISNAWGPYIQATNVLSSGNLTFQIILTTGIKGELKDNSKHVWTKDKKAYCLGDSLTASPFIEGEDGRKWMANFVALAGTNTDLKWQYDNHIAWGGTRTLQANNLSGQMRARNLLSLITPDILFIQNINDAQYFRVFGNVTDESFMTSEINDVSVTPLSDEASAQNYFIENISSCLTGVTAKHGVIMKVPYEIENGKILTLSGSVTTSGTISISFGSGAIVYGIEIEVGDSVEDIVNKIVEYDYGGIEDAKISSSQVSFATNESVNITNGNGELGIICTVTSGAAVSYTSFCFVSHDTSNWFDTAYWKPIMQVSLISQYKGLIEYLLTNAPKCRIYILGFPRMVLQYDSNTYKRADGTWNWDTFKAAFQTSYDLAETQKKAAEYMNVQYFDIFTDSGINIYNMETFYYGSNNVHLNNDGYDRLGETVYRKLI